MRLTGFATYLFWAYSAVLVTSLAGMEMVSWLTFGLFLYQAFLDLREKKGERLGQLFRSYPVIFALIFFVSSAISAFHSPFATTSPITAIGVNRSIFLIFGFAYVWQNQFLNLSKKYFIFIFSVITAVCFYALFQFFTGMDLVRGVNQSVEPIGNFFRPVGFFRNPLTLAYILGMLLFAYLPIRHAQVLDKKSISRPLFFLCMGSLVLAILATSARGAWLSAFIVVNIFLFLLRSKRLFIVSTSAMIAAFALLMNNATFNGRVRSITDLANISNSDRFTIWRANWDLIKDNFFWGVGYNVNNSNIFERYAKLNISPPHLGPEHHAHSDIVQAFSGGGLFGVTFYLLMIVSFMIMSYGNWKHISSQFRLQKLLALGLFLSQIFVHLGGLTQCNYTDREVNHAMTFVWAFTLALYLGRKAQVAEIVRPVDQTNNILEFVAPVQKVLQKYPAALLGGVLCIFAIGLYHRAPHIDDGWLGEQAYFLATTGHVKSNLFTGVLSYEKAVLVYHKLFIWTGAVVTKVFGFHLFTLKSIALVFLGLFSWFFWKSSTELWGFRRNDKLIFLSLLVCFHLVYELSFVFRPEILLMFSAYVIFYSLSLYFKTERIVYLITGALTSGISVLLHLNGLVFFAAATLFLFIYKRDFKILLFLAIATTVSLFYFSNIHNYDDLLIFKQHFLMDPAIYKSQFRPSFATIPERILNEHKRFFSHGYTIALMILFFGSLWVIKKERKSFSVEEKHVMVFFGLCTLFLAVLTHGKTNKYLLFVLPYMLYFIVKGLNQKRLHLAVAIPFVAYLVINLTKNISYTTKQHNRMAAYAEILRDITTDKIILGPLEIIFDELPRHTFIGDKGQVLIAETYAVPKDKGPTSLIDQLKIQKFDYLVVSPTSEEKFNRYLPELKQALGLTLVKRNEDVNLYSVEIPSTITP